MSAWGGSLIESTGPIWIGGMLHQLGENELRLIARDTALILVTSESTRFIGFDTEQKGSQLYYHFVIDTTHRYRARGQLVGDTIVTAVLEALFRERTARPQAARKP